MLRASLPSELRSAFRTELPEGSPHGVELPSGPVTETILYESDADVICLLEFEEDLRLKLGERCVRR